MLFLEIFLPFEVDVLPDNRLLFTVSKAVHVTKIMNLCPWSIKGSLLVLKPWLPQLTIDEVDLSCCDFWVQIHGLHHQYMDSVNAARIGKSIGNLPDVENCLSPGILCNNFLCIRVSIDITQPLVSGFHLPRQGCSSLWVDFLYERLSIYCTSCGLIGHRKTICPDPPSPGLQFMYGLSLRGPDLHGIRISPPIRHVHQHVFLSILSCYAPKALLLLCRVWLKILGYRCLRRIPWIPLDLPRFVVLNWPRLHPPPI